ncbi:MAG TPA: peptide chain release factor N(5)-glutamine methyltransferase, partial [Microbacterium sp.]|nr:peptide chain release factor N(5)-glutamine methyltransferase [Microbacterium sp.]
MPHPADPASAVDLSALLRAAAHTLAEAGVADPHVDVELLAGHVLGIGRGQVQAASVRGDRIAED